MKCEANKGLGEVITAEVSLGCELASTVGTRFFCIGSYVLFDALFAEAMRASKVDGSLEELPADGTGEAVIQPGVIVYGDVELLLY